MRARAARSGSREGRARRLRQHRARATQRAIADEPRLELVGATDVVPGPRGRARRASTAARATRRSRRCSPTTRVDAVVNLTRAGGARRGDDAPPRGGQARAHREAARARATTRRGSSPSSRTRRGVRLSCAPATLLGEAQQTAWKLVRDGALGTRSRRLRRGELGPDRALAPVAASRCTRSGPLVDVGIYPLTILTAMFGPARRVSRVRDDGRSPSACARDGARVPARDAGLLRRRRSSSRTASSSRLTATFWVGAGQAARHRAPRRRRRRSSSPTGREFDSRLELHDATARTYDAGAAPARAVPRHRLGARRSSTSPTRSREGRPHRDGRRARGARRRGASRRSRRRARGPAGRGALGLRAPRAARLGPLASLHAADEHAQHVEVVRRATTTSARAPGLSAPTSARRAARAGTRVAASTASSKRDAEPHGVADRVAHGEHASREDAVERAHDAVAHLDRHRRPCATSPSPAPVAAMPSVTSATRPRAARHATSAASSETWWPSRISSTVTSSRTSAAPAMPGSRCVNGRIALKRCVTCVAPRSNAARASSAVASVWPQAATTPARPQRVDELQRAVAAPARASCAPPVPRRASRSSSATSGSRRAEAGCMPSRSGERNGPSRWTPSTRGPMSSAGTSRSDATSSSSGAVTNVGWNAVTPVASIASPARRYAAASAAAKSTPPKPWTCRSTKPGTAMPVPAPRDADARRRGRPRSRRRPRRARRRRAPPRRRASQRPQRRVEPPEALVAVGVRGHRTAADRARCARSRGRSARPRRAGRANVPSRQPARSAAP